MKLLELRLLAFGPFTDVVLPLAAGSHGLHIIHGPNEAGKSTALRAIEALLFGIDGRTDDGFLHEYAELRIGGSIRGSNAPKLDFIRRKGRKKTLRDRSDTAVLRDEALDVYLGGVDRTTFTTMFGLGREALVRGGREVLEGKGRLGELLFAAGSGLSGVRATMIALKEEADELFTAKGRSQRITQAISQHADLGRQIKSLAGQSANWSVWNEHLRALDNRRAEMVAQVSDLRQRHRRLERIRNSIGLIAARKALLSEQAACAGAALLAEDFRQRRREAEIRLQTGRRDREEIRPMLDAIDAELEQPAPDGGVLAESDAIESLHRELGGYLRATNDRLGLLRESELLSDQALRIAADLRPGIDLEGAKALRVRRTEAAKIVDLAAKWETLAARIQSSETATATLRGKIAKLEDDLAQCQEDRDVGALRRLVAEAALDGDLEQRRSKLEAELAAEHRLIAKQIDSLRYWSGSPDEFASLTLPTLESIDSIDAPWTKARGQRDACKAEIEQSRQRVDEFVASLASLTASGQAPSESDLTSARYLRDEGLALVKRALKGDRDASAEREFVLRFPPAMDLAEAVEKSVRAADDLSDRLRREADAVARRASLESSLAVESAKLERLNTSLQNLDEEIAELDERWAELWSPSQIKPKSPREMRAWLQSAAKLTDQVGRWQVRQNENRDLSIQITRNLAAFRDAFQELRIAVPAPTLAAARSLAETLIADIDRSRNRGDSLRRQLDERRDELRFATATADLAQKELEAWRLDWAKAVGVVGLPADASAAEAKAVVDSMLQIAEKLDDREDKQTRIAQIDEACTKFVRSVADVCLRVAPDGSHTPADAAVSNLYARLTKARQLQVRRETLSAQRDSLTERQSHIAKEIDEAAATLAVLCREAGCDSPDQLPECENRSDKRRQIERDLADVHRQLMAYSGGEPVEEFVRIAEGVPPDVLEAEWAQLADQITSLEAERSALDERIGGIKKELSAIDGDGKAASLAEDQQAKLAEIRGLVEHYLRLKLMSTVLDAAVQRYRAESEQPMLKRAGDIFRKLTLGSFSGLSTEYSDDGEPFLVGVRPGRHKPVPVAGMSEGTADQLYLALRLASVESYLDEPRNEPIPFIVDDILVNFDDDRSKAALEVLADLSSRTQVIFFTHHRHLVDLAESCLTSETVFVHELPARDAAGQPTPV